MARQFIRTPRKEKLWTGIGGIQLALVADGTVIGGSIGFNEPQTIIRMLFEYSVSATSAPAALDSAGIHIALGVFSTDAVAAGAASLPDPGSEPQYPWLYWMDHHVFFSTTDPDSSSAAASVRKYGDIRTMRKVKPRESLVWVVQYGDLNGTPPLSVGIGDTRVLLAVH